MPHNHHAHKTNTENIKTAFFLNLAFTIVEFIGGYFTNSLAILSDALHDLGDSLSLGLSWYFQKKSSKGATKKYSYGYKRFSLLGAIINSVILLIGSLFIIKEALPALFKPEQAHAQGMMWIAILGIIVNGLAVFKLRQGTSINERVVSLHLLEDVLGWVAVLIASIVMQFFDVPILDPLLSIFIALFVLYNVFKNLKESFKIILMATPKNITIEAVKQRIMQFDDVLDMHDSHLWTLDGSYNIFTAHLILKENAVLLHQTERVKKEVKQVLHSEFNLEHITLEFELENEMCSYRDQE